MVDYENVSGRELDHLSDSSESAGSRSIWTRDSDDSPTRKTETSRSRRSNLNELRENFEDDPELYGIRRSERNKREPYRYSTPSGSVAPRSRRSTRLSDSDDSDHPALTKVRQLVHTRGNRVSYRSAFADDSSDDSDDGVSASRSRLQSVPSPLYKPRGSLIRRTTFEQRPKNNNRFEGQGSPGAVEDADSDHSEGPLPTEDEADYIEEVLNHAVRRKSAVGNQTTVYNCRLEKDPNEGFKPDREPGELQYLIKWKNWSHIHSTWETESSLLDPDRPCPVVGLKKLHQYNALIREQKRQLERAGRDDVEAILYEEERRLQVLDDKMCVERIIAHNRDPHNNGFDYLIKWKGLEYRFCTWESGKVISQLYPSDVVRYETRCRSSTIPTGKCEVVYQRPKFSPLLTTPSYIGNSDFRLRDYQLEGVNWIIRAWCRTNSAILADEMGLGKTIQTICFISYLFHEHSVYGPSLLVVPLSTVSSWQREAQIWASDVNWIVYTGDHISRQLIREYEWFSSGNGFRRSQQYKFNVCITTYEILLKDKSWLGGVPWVFLGVDEAHRLKNDQSQLYKALQAFNTNTRLLITGTPLQNSMKELWALLHFIMPEKFASWEEFEEEHSVTDDVPTSQADSEVFHNLHKVLKPYLLRRVKKDVESSLPEKTEQILRVDMTNSQANIYRLILARNYDGLMKVTKGHKASFINIVMELKKCCNHSYLIAPPTNDQLTCLESLIRGSGKMLLLDKLLQRLRQGRHRVLIFSQMVRMLDIIADYLQLRGWGYQRLDGSIRSELRKQALDHFNADGSTDFCFLLSTRAGGLGINLATADTVVIFDSDWNPQNDLQAQARAHRIGQTKQVSVYRLVTRSSVEEKIIESATRKMVLDHLVIQRMDSSGRRGIRKGESTKRQLLTEILRHGADDLFNQNNDEEMDVELDIDDVLKSAETRDADASTANSQANALLSSFKSTVLDVVDDDIDESTDNLRKTWEDIIPVDLRQQVKKEDAQSTLVSLELGPRKRRRVKAFQAGVECNSSDESSDQECINKASCGLSKKDIRALVRAIKRFARPLDRIDAIAVDADLSDVSEKDIREAVEAVLKGCREAADGVSDAENKLAQSKGPVFEYGQVLVSVKPLLQCLENLDVLHKWSPTLDKIERSKLQLPFAPKFVAWSCPWDCTDDSRLLAGVFEHGYDNWEAIKLDVDLGLGSKLLPPSSNDRPQANHLRTRVDYLLRMLTKSDLHGREDSGKSTRTSAKKSKLTRAPKPVKVPLGNAPSIQPKSAEFVDTDDSSSDSDQVRSATSCKRPKTEHKVKTHVIADRSKNNSVPLHYTASQPPMPILEQDGIRELRGPVFKMCKEKLKPIKKHLKALERLEDSQTSDKKSYTDVLLSIGNHIHSVLEDFGESASRHEQKGHLWEFVELFSKKSAHELKQIYRHALKKSHKTNSAHHRRMRDSAYHSSHRERKVDKFDDRRSNKFERQFDRDRSDIRFNNAFNRPPSFYNVPRSYGRDPPQSRSAIPSEMCYQSSYSTNQRTKPDSVAPQIASTKNPRDPRLSTCR